MLDLKQLQYFVVSADVCSFSEAAKILYTTQSNVSKSIQALEKELSVKLFYREARGISLTAQGKNVYQYARNILDRVDELENLNNAVPADWLNISSGPSAWFARSFTEFYNLHYTDHIHCRVQNASNAEILNRVCDCKDELGFLYVFEDHQDVFQYNLERKHLEFHPLKQLETMVYLGKKHPEYSADKLQPESLSHLRLVQMYKDEFTDNREWIIDTTEGEMPLGKPYVAVITNSDYIMEEMLNNSRLSNISAAGMEDEAGTCQEGCHHLKQEGGGVIFGYVQRKNEKLSVRAEMFVDFIRGKLETEA